MDPFFNDKFHTIIYPGPHSALNNEETFSSYYEAFSSELLENLEEMLPLSDRCYPRESINGKKQYEYICSNFLHMTRAKRRFSDVKS